VDGLFCSSRVISAFRPCVKRKMKNVVLQSDALSETPLIVSLNNI